jgi:hypothetical protein
MLKLNKVDDVEKIAHSRERSRRPLAEVRYFLRDRGAAILNGLTLLVGVSIFFYHFIAPISEAGLVEIVVGFFILFSLNAWCERVTTIADIEKKIGAIRERAKGISSQIVSVHAHALQVSNFLRGSDFNNKLRTTVMGSNKLLRTLDRAGIDGAYKELREVGLAEKIRKADSVRILSNWVGDLAALGPAFVGAVGHGCKIRILILQHDSAYAKMRSLELTDGADDEIVGKQISGEILEFSRLFNNNPILRGNVVVRAYNAHPVMCLFAYDEVRLIGLFWRKELVMNTPFLKVVENTDRGILAGLDDGRNRTTDDKSVSKMVDEHFESIWEDKDTRFITLINGEPTYVASESEAW